MRERNKRNNPNPQQGITTISSPFGPSWNFLPIPGSTASTEGRAVLVKQGLQ